MVGAEAKVADGALLLGFTLPDDEARSLFAIDPMPAVQTHKFAWSLARALRIAHGEVRLLSAAPVQNYPRVPKLFFAARTFVEHGIEGRTLPFVNVLGLKHLTRLLACLPMLRTLRRWGIGTVYVHGVHSPYLLFSAILHALGYRVIIVLTDPPGVVLPTDGALARYLKRADRTIVRALIRRADAVVALSPALAHGWAPGRPALIVPGIGSSSWSAAIAARARGVPRSGGTPRVLYAGGLTAAYGVDRLLDAAALLPSVEFRFCGKGDQLDRIRSTAPSNVTYGGFVGPEELVDEMLAADLLINPRPSSARFAAESFPSKLLEYLASGRPVMTTRISSIPEELIPLFCFIDDESGSGIARAIEHALEDFGALQARGAAAAAEVERLYGETSTARALSGLVKSVDRDR